MNKKQTKIKTELYEAPWMRTTLIALHGCLAASFGMGDANDGGSLYGSDGSNFGMGDANDGGSLD